MAKAYLTNIMACSTIGRVDASAERTSIAGKAGLNSIPGESYRVEFA